MLIKSDTPLSSASAEKFYQQKAMQDPEFLEAVRKEFSNPDKPMKEDSLKMIGYYMSLGFTDFLSEEGKIFPVRKEDDFETIVKRYWELFPVEAETFLFALKQQKSNLHKDNGMTKGGTMRLGVTIPQIIYCAIRCIDAEAWFGPNMRKTVQKLMQVAPAYFQGNF